MIKPSKTTPQLLLSRLVENTTFLIDSWYPEQKKTRYCKKSHQHETITFSWRICCSSMEMDFSLSICFSNHSPSLPATCHSHCTSESTT